MATQNLTASPANAADDLEKFRVNVMLGGTHYEIVASSRGDVEELEAFADQLLALAEHIAAGLETNENELELDLPSALWAVLRTARSILLNVREFRGEQAAGSLPMPARAVATPAV